MTTYNISGLKIATVQRESCLRLVQFFKGQSVTCACSVCAARGQTPEQAKASLIAAHSA